MTIGSGDIVKDVYGREVREEFPKVKEFFEAFGTRDSAKRDADKGVVAEEGPMRMMQTWEKGIGEIDSRILVIHCRTCDA